MSASNDKNMNLSKTDTKSEAPWKASVAGIAANMAS